MTSKTPGAFFCSGGFVSGQKGKYLVSNAPVDHGLGGLAAAGAHIAELLLLKGHATAGKSGLFLHLHLTGQIAAPHGLDVCL